MLKNKIITCVIPARLASGRFPGKVLAPLGGKPLLQWAFDKAKQVSFFDHVAIAVDSKELYEAVCQFADQVFLTSPDCPSGTDRLVELRQSQQLSGDIWVNWQGDEPFISEETIATLLQSIEDPAREIWTLKKKIDSPQDITSPHIVKVVCDEKGKALYFSRSPIPHSQKNVYKHIGLYAFSDRALEKIGKLHPCQLEREERLEQLRFLYYGIPIHVHETNQEIFGIDTKEELAIAETMCYHFA